MPYPVSYTHLDDFCDIINNKPGFVKAIWCGCQECEDRIKDELAATSRCMPFEPVSYTHLDVYKRQILCNATSS